MWGGVQVATLTRLRHLSLSRLSSPPEGYDALAGLSCLERLELQGVSPGSPACLSRLTSLKALRLFEGWRMEGAEPYLECASALEQGLAPLTQLTQLVLSQPIAALPQALTRLTQLQRLAWADPLGGGAPLPDGPWLASLAAVEVPPAVAAASLQQGLGSAPRLEYLGLLPVAASGATQRVQLWMAEHRPHWIRSSPFPQRLGFSAQPLPCHPLLLDFWADHAMWGLDEEPFMDWFEPPTGSSTAEEISRQPHQPALPCLAPHLCHAARAQRCALLSSVFHAH